MINVYQLDTMRRWRTVPFSASATLYLLTAISPDEQKKIAQALHLPLEWMQLPQEEFMAPPVEKRAEGFSFFVQVPVAKDKAADDPAPGQYAYNTTAVRVICTDRHLVIVGGKGIEFMPHWLNRVYPSNVPITPVALASQWMQMVAEMYLGLIKSVSMHIAWVQRQLQYALFSNELYTLMALSRSLAYCLVALKDLQNLLKNLMDRRCIQKSADEMNQLDLTLIDVQRATAVMEIRAGSLSRLMNGYASIIQNNVHTVLKILSVALIFLIVPMVVTAYWTVNTLTPYEHAPFMFTVILLACLLIIAGFAWDFAKRGFFER
ncbi:MAG: hypothetical protein OWS74_01255 [Firmicutes bacterium]|nr:hypothetical protein [Bacillota bacterium]